MESNWCTNALTARFWPISIPTADVHRHVLLFGIRPGQSYLVVVRQKKLR